jgi:hypothetical protein
MCLFGSKSDHFVAKVTWKLMFRGIKLPDKILNLSGSIDY